MDKLDRIAKVEATWCVGCKNMSMRNISKTRKQNQCHVSQQMKASVFHPDTLPKEIDLHKVACSKFEMKKY